MDSWQLVWRQGLAPGLSLAALEALREGLRTDDSRLLQDVTTSPPAVNCCANWPVEAACAIGFAGWRGEGLVEVGQVAEYFARACFAADERLHEPAACRWFLSWFDDTPRPQMIRELLAEVELAIAERARAAQ